MSHTANDQLTFEQACELFSYSPETGSLTWRVDRGAARIGREAGIAKPNKPNCYYRIVGVFGVPYQAHRIAWLIHYGSWPSGQLDHIDGDGLNNRISNLRVVDASGNARNLRQKSNNTSGVTGVYWCKHKKKWRAKMKVGRKYIHVGYFNCLDDARIAISSARAIHGFHPNHGSVRKSPGAPA